jgi:hypothetical protein
MCVYLQIKHVAIIPTKKITQNHNIQYNTQYTNLYTSHKHSSNFKHHNKKTRQSG